jgi:ParB family chromosome partitioning protein
MTTPASTAPWRQIIAPDRLHPGPDNPREDPGDIPALTASIRRHGLKHPVLVVPRGGESQEFDIEDGWRRWLAMRDWMTGIPCVVMPQLPGERRPVRAIFTALVTDAYRKDLNQIERAKGFQRLQKEFGFTATEIAGQIGMSVSTVTNALMLLELAPETQQAVAEKKISATEVGGLLRRYRAKQRRKLGKQPIAPKWEPDWFTPQHALAKQAGELCDRREHNMRRRIGKVACGQCWESVIRRDQDKVNEAPSA